MSSNLVARSRENSQIKSNLRGVKAQDLSLTPNHTKSDNILAIKALPPSSQPGNVSVICRFRPLNEKEKNISTDLCAEFVDSSNLILRSQGENNIYKFGFDRVFGPNSTQKEVYDFGAKPIIESVLEGFNGTIFAYGQTASGKTHTMQGVLDDEEQSGIIPRMIRNVFQHIFDSPPEIEFIVKVSMIEIYQEKIRDLIDTQRVNLNVREDRTKGLYIEDLSEHYVGDQEEVLEIMRIGSENRSIACTNMNEHSSRSHSIFIMTLSQNNVKEGIAKTGKLYLVDLAGSEKISKTGATGLTLEEAKTINKSLTTLGMVINSLTDGKSSYIPYRDSKLTRVLQESLGGNAKTCLIITCSPSVYNEAESLSTLRFGLRAKKIKNKPKINKEVTVAELKLEIEKLEEALAKANKRISQLEEYIAQNGLALPGEDEKIKIQIQPNAKSDDEDEEEEEEEEEEEVEEKEKELGKKQKQIIYISKDNPSENLIRNTTGISLMTEQLKKERDLSKFQENKITEYTNKMNNLEYNNQKLNQKLDIAICSLQDCESLKESKEQLIFQLTNIKEHYDLKEKELEEKIKLLESDIEESKKEKEKIKIELVNMQEATKDVEKERNSNNEEVEESGSIRIRESLAENEPQFLKDEALLGKLINMINEMFVDLLRNSLDKDLRILINEYREKVMTQFNEESTQSQMKPKEEEKSKEILPNQTSEDKPPSQTIFSQDSFKTDNVINEMFLKLRQSTCNNHPIQKIIKEYKESIRLPEFNIQTESTLQFEAVEKKTEQSQPQPKLSTTVSELKQELVVNELFEKLTQSTKEQNLLQMIDDYKKKVLHHTMAYTKLNEDKSLNKKDTLAVSPNAIEKEIENFNIPASATSTNNINYEEILEAKSKKYDSEKKIILKALEEKSERLCQIEIEKKELVEKYKSLESKLTSEDKNYVKKLVSLEKNLDQLNKMFQNVQAQKSSITVDNEMLETKLKRRNDYSNQLEKELMELKEQLKAKDEKMNGYLRGTMRDLGIKNNVVRVLKGGHVKQNALILNGQLNFQPD